MSKMPKQPLRPINEWVRRALDHTPKSDAAVARELHARGLIGTPDRSVPGKMATERDVKAAEMLALSEITGYPPMGSENRPAEPSRMVSTFDPDAPDEISQDDSTDETPPPSPKGDIANLAIRGGLGLGSRDGVEKFDGGEIYSDHVNGFWSFPDVVKAGWRNMPQVYSIPVTGDSMEPTLTSGSYVFIDMTHVVPTPEDIYACDYGDGLTIKRLQMIPRSDKIMVMSDNDRYANYELRREDVRVYGRVVAWFQWRG